MRIKRIQQLRSSRRQIACEKCEKWRSFARSSVERHANIKINESQVFSMRNTFFVASRGQFISRVHVQLNINSLQNFGFSEHARKLPKALTRVITEIDVPIGKTARSQYVDFHTSCESPHKNVSFPSPASAELIYFSLSEFFFFLSRATTFHKKVSFDVWFFILALPAAKSQELIMIKLKKKEAKRM